MAMSKHVSPPLLRQQSTKVARELLQKVRDEGVDADAIFQRAGFSDATTFSCGFKAWAGIAPSAYRSGLPSFA